MKGRIKFVVSGLPFIIETPPQKVFAGRDINNFTFPIFYENAPATTLTAGQVLGSHTEPDISFTIKSVAATTISGSGTLVAEFDGYLNIAPGGSLTFNVSMLGITLNITILVT